ncbi:hypothetical protein [Brevibacillus sp. NRS-1366]|uniref:beta barrel domain-containing protein n=1 Tax=Brevibacillus sp. NRS-1366 TaxID=3233899 RepID=UPI003D1AB9E1
MNKLEVGMKVYLKPDGNMARHTEDIKEMLIKKIGRKYFEVWDGSNERWVIKFDLKEYNEVTDYAADWKLYFNKQDILDEAETQKLKWDIEKKINTLTLEQLKKISTIIESE